MPQTSLSKQTKLIKTDDFSSVFNFRKRITGKHLVFHYKLECLDQEISLPKDNLFSVRVGLAVSKKVAKHATDRNYMKRVLRELVRVKLSQMMVVQYSLMKLDVVIRVQTVYSSRQFMDIKKEFTRHFDDILRKIR